MLQTSSMVHASALQRRTPPALTPIIIALSLTLPGAAYAAGPLPNGGRFVAGTGSISGNSTSLTINQASNRGVIDWNSFSIGNGNRVSILNGTGATLNRVTGGNLSAILGTLWGTGSVYLINPQGIIIGSRGVVSTGGRFVASTLGTDNRSFMNGGPLSLSGTASGNIVNLGQIASSGGDVFLIASKNVVNLGTIGGSKGTAELAAGQTVLLQDSSTSRQVFVQKGSSGTIVNLGTLEAAQIDLQAADGNIFALAGNHAGPRAMGTSTRDGHVWLVADSGKIAIDGAIVASNANGSGGTVDTSAAHLIIAGDANANPFVKADQWNITTPSFVIGRLAAPVFARSLDNGTSIDLHTTGARGASGNIDVASDIQWLGAASLTLRAYHSLTVEARAKLKNSATGNLTLRADSNAVDNGGSVINNGTVDWSASQGIVSAFYDMNGSYKGGTLLANASWTSPAYSGLLTQITGYKLVNSFSDLRNVSTDLAGNYALGKNIDASAPKGSYVPIGIDEHTPFTGQFDGQGHTIKSLVLYAQSKDEYDLVFLGLFGVLGAGSIVRNLDVNGTALIEGAPRDVPGSYSNAFGFEGILAGENGGSILRVNTSGSITGSDLFKNVTQVGGLVGVNLGGTIERSASSVTIATPGLVAGGLVGRNDGIIDQSYASGSVSGFAQGGSNQFPGGLVGSNDGRISKSYATGAVTNSCFVRVCSVGGLVDLNNAGGINQSFASGTLTIHTTSDPEEQGLFGAIAAESYNFAIANDVYWNMDTTRAAGIGFGPRLLPASHGLTTAQMSNPASFSGWDFSATGVWALPAGYNHPILRWQLEPPLSN